jgi:hypothetical protein
MSHDSLSPSFFDAFVAHLVQEKNTLLAVTSTGFGLERRGAPAFERAATLSRLLPDRL